MIEKLKTETNPINNELAREELESFMANPGLADLADLFGVSDLPTSITEKIDVLQQIATEYWDFRKGAERQDVNWDDDLLDREDSRQRRIVLEAANKLGLVQNTVPLNTRPNTLAILGGANKSPLRRLMYGLGIVEDFDQVVYLGSSRSLPEAEKERTFDYAPEAQTEFDLGCSALEKVLSAEEIDEISIKRDGDIWGMKLYGFELRGQKKTAFALSTPQQIGQVRATTYDNYRFYADRAELANDPNHSVVAVTNAFYTKGQQLPAVQELTVPYGVQVETVGFSVDYDGTILKPCPLLMETKAAIDAAARLELVLR